MKINNIIVYQKIASYKSKSIERKKSVTTTQYKIKQIITLV